MLSAAFSASALLAIMCSSLRVQVQLLLFATCARYLAQWSDQSYRWPIDALCQRCKADKRKDNMCKSQTSKQCDSDRGRGNARVYFAESCAKPLAVCAQSEQLSFKTVSYAVNVVRIGH